MIQSRHRLNIFITFAAYAGNEDLKPKMSTAGQETIENDYQNATLSKNNHTILQLNQIYIET